MTTIKRVRRERALSETDFSSPAKRYKLSRRRIVVDDFDREAIRRRIYQVYEETCTSNTDDPVSDGSTSEDEATYNCDCS